MRASRLVVAGLIASLAAALGLVPAVALGQACCAATAAAEFGTVGSGQQGTIAARLGWRRALGTFDAAGGWRRLDDAQIDDFTLDLGGGWRPGGGPWQVQAVLPLHLQARTLGTLEGGPSPGVGDVGLGVRATVVPAADGRLRPGEWASWRPAVDAFASVRLPSGRAPEDGEDATGSDVTGDGHVALAGGLRATRQITRQGIVAVRGQVGRRLPREVPGPSAPIQVEPGWDLDLQVDWIHVQSIAWSFGLTGGGAWASDSFEDGARVPASGSRRLRLGGHVTRSFDRQQWEWIAAATIEPWWSGAAANVPFSGPALTLAVRRNLF